MFYNNNNQRKESGITDKPHLIADMRIAYADQSKDGTSRQLLCFVFLDFKKARVA